MIMLEIVVKIAHKLSLYLFNIAKACLIMPFLMWHIIV